MLPTASAILRLWYLHLWYGNMVSFSLMAPPISCIRAYGRSHTALMVCYPQQAQICAYGICAYGMESVGNHLIHNVIPFLSTVQGAMYSCIQSQ